MFTVKIEDKDVELKVVEPTKDHLNKAKKIYNEAFHEAIQSKAPLRKFIFNILEQQGLWDEEKQAKLDSLRKEINQGEFSLKKGGMSLKKARELAIDVRRKRLELSQLLNAHNELDNITAEGQATNAEFNCLVALCTVYNDSGKPYFSGYEDFMSRADDDVSIEAAKALASLIYNFDEDSISKLPENAFLKKYKFVDEKLRLIDDKGRLINIHGQLINENNQLINEEGKRIDVNGHPLTDEGEFDVESLPFLDDDGNPVL